MRLGLIGLGFMGAMHLREFRQIPDVELTAVCAQNPKVLAGDLSDAGGNLGTVGETYDFSTVRKFRDWRKMIFDREVDVIDVCLPTDLHGPVALAALEAGKDLLCEKPMALTLSDCEGMIESARAHDQVLMIGHVLRFWPEYQRLAQAVRTKEWGVISSLKLRRVCGLPDWSRWLPDEGRSGGAVIDLLIHDIDQAVQILGMPKSVAAIAEEKKHDTVQAVLQYRDGVTVEISGGWYAPSAPFAMSFEAIFEGGTLNFSAEDLNFITQAGISVPVHVPRNDAYASEVSYFVECCRRRASPIRCLPEESAQSLRLALLIKESRSRTGETISCLG